ncbi:MAG: ribbon-helix-helix protein, CopG family [Nitriliruptor sp.]|nr:MAG: ribbon-helix-helix protein, CopG family [Nitriliruptor sp.]TVR28459.1 MAG: ribbon-helix-helix protein, CopG family [Nitriliruptor sp.]
MSHRTQITLTDEQYELLRSESHRRGVGLAELVRRAINRTYGSTDRDDQRAALQESFGAWGPGQDGAAFVDDLRRGMSHRLSVTNQ